MTVSVPPEEYSVEILTPDRVTTSPGGTFADLTVSIDNILVTGEPVVPEVIEVPEYPPAGGGISPIEVVTFTRVGVLDVVLNAPEFPVVGGVFRLESVGGRVRVPPTGSSVILDVLKNGVSIYSNPSDRPSIDPGANEITTVLPTGVMLANDDYIEIHIVSVGSTVPGTDLVVSIRLARIGR